MADTTPEGRRFGRLLREARESRGLSLAALGRLTSYNRGFISNIEAGRRFPGPRFAELAGDALGVRTDLVRTWRQAEDERQEREATLRALRSSTREAATLAADAGTGEAVERLDEAVRRVAMDYLGTSPAAMLRSAGDLRAQVRRLLVQHCRPEHQADLYLLAGYLSGVLAYAALDLGDPDAAVANAHAAWTCGDRAGHSGLLAWVRGTQALIARFQGEYDEALALARDGLSHATVGTAVVRLRCGEAQSLANKGDARAANIALNQAMDAREHAGPDPIGGLFGFSVAKQHYYAGSSLIWLDSATDAQRARREVIQALNMWESAPDGERPQDDEALARIYLATAYLNLSDLDGAAESLDLVLGLPPERRISWIGKRLERLDRMLTDRPFAGNHVAAGLREQIALLA